MLGTILLTAAVLYAGFSALLFVSQTRLLYLPNIAGREIVATPKDIGLDYQPITLATADGIRLDAWFIPATDARRTVLFFHGNAGNISHRLDSIAVFQRLGLNVLIIDYRGYGRSTGRPSEHGTYRDAEAAWRFLTEDRNLTAPQIVLFGRSLGAAVATWLATQHTPGALMIESSFTSVPDIAAELYPMFPVRLLARLRYDARSYLRSVDCPVLVIHSRDDEIIPFHHGQALYEAAPEPKQFLEIHGGHNDGFLRSANTYTAGIASFLDSI